MKRTPADAMFVAGALLYPNMSAPSGAEDCHLADVDSRTDDGQMKAVGSAITLTELTSAVRPSNVAVHAVAGSLRCSKHGTLGNLCLTRAATTTTSYEWRKIDRFSA